MQCSKIVERQITIEDKFQASVSPIQQVDILQITEKTESASKLSFNKKLSKKSTK